MPRYAVRFGQVVDNTRPDCPLTLVEAELRLAKLDAETLRQPPRIGRLLARDAVSLERAIKAVRKPACRACAVGVAVQSTPENTMTQFQKRPVVIDAVQLCWRNWSDVCELFAGDLINADNPARSVETFSDKCGEEAGPWIELDDPDARGRTSSPATATGSSRAWRASSTPASLTSSR